jgi:hypothetical protein
VPYCRLTNIGATTREVYYRSSEIFQNSGRWLKILRRQTCHIEDPQILGATGGRLSRWIPGCRPQTPKTEIQIFYRHDDTKVLREWPFSRNQPLKPTDDWYIKFLKNTLIQLPVPLAALFKA